MRVLLISTYELGRQPVNLASPAAALRAEGHEVETVDLAVESLTTEAVRAADRVAISVPMHTATRMADQVIHTIREQRPDVPVALYGLYAGVGTSNVDARFEGEYEPGLLGWMSGVTAHKQRHLGRSEFVPADRTGLPPLEDYARLERPGDDGAVVTELAGAVEASHGCRHRCRHCPIPAVYDGRIRIVPQSHVRADIGALIAAGARHITFGDADFLNAPRHSLDIIERVHAEHPEVTFDATIKVEHLLEHRDLLPRLAAANLLFIISAFESVDDDTLAILDKGHSAADMTEALALTRDVGVHLRPTWLPFMPWTTPRDLASLFEFLEREGLAGATDPVQLAIKLLIPRGSLLESQPAIAPHLTAYDETGLTWDWDFVDPDTAQLHEELERMASQASDCGQEAHLTLDLMREAVSERSGAHLEPFRFSAPTPRLTESWYCCAEPTERQSVSIQIGTR